MQTSPSAFWKWFRRFASQLTAEDPSDSTRGELLSQLQKVDSRLYFEISNNTAKRELIITARGIAEVFPAVDAFVAKAPKIRGWSFIALKPPMGFDFLHRNGGLELKASSLWFLPLQCADDPQLIGLRLAVPSRKAALRLQSVAMAYTILSTAIGERSYAEDIGFVELSDRPADPGAERYMELPLLPGFIEAWKRLQGK